MAYPAAGGAKNMLPNKTCVKSKNNLIYFNNPVKIPKTFLISQNTGLK
jgi:hypothetical protein